MKFQIIEDNIRRLHIFFDGVNGTPYEGGKFLLDFTIVEKYASKPPKVLFITKIMHPNIVFETGEICLDILRDRWTPSLQIRTIFISILVLLSCPNPDSPVEAVTAKMMIEEPERYQKVVRLCTRVYAKEGSQGNFFQCKN